MSFKQYCEEHGIHYKSASGYLNKQGFTLNNHKFYKKLVGICLANKTFNRKEIIEQAGFDYTNFRKWVSNYGVGLKDITMEQLNLYINDYKLIRKQKEFYARVKEMGINIDYLNKFIKYHYGVTFSQVDPEDYETILKEYQKVRKK